MLTNLNKQDLIDFEEDIASEFNQAKIKAPVHLYQGNEAQMLNIFENVEKDDWIFCSWRSHYQCLLKGVPPHIIKESIMAGKSITLNFPEYNVFSSAIVTGSVQNILTFEGVNDEYITYYKYETKWPHAGAGSRVQF